MTAAIFPINQRTGVIVMDLDSLHPIPDCSPRTILELSRRIERSKTEEQLVYRECEIDELWRLLKPGHSAPQAQEPDAQRREALQRAVFEAHDLIGINGDVAAAAVVLRAAIT